MHGLKPFESLKRENVWCSMNPSYVGSIHVCHVLRVGLFIIETHKKILGRAFCAIYPMTNFKYIQAICICSTM